MDNTPRKRPRSNPSFGGVGRGSHLTPSPLGGRPGSALGGHHRHRADGRPSSALGDPPGLSIRKINFSTSPSPQPGAENGGGLAPRPTSAPNLPPVHLAVRALQAGGDRCLQLVPDGDQRPRQPPAGAASRPPAEILPASTPHLADHKSDPALFPSPRRSGRRARRRATRSRRSRAPGAPSKPTRSTRRSRSRSSRRRRPAAPRQRAPPSPPLAVASARTRSCRRRPPRRRAAARGGGRRRRSPDAPERARRASRRQEGRTSQLLRREEAVARRKYAEEFGAYREVRAACTRSEADPPATMCVIPPSPREPPTAPRWCVEAVWWLYALTQLCQPTRYWRSD